MKRKSNNKVELRPRGLILCEGETEVRYFTDFLTLEKHRRKFTAIDVKAYKPKNHSPVGLVHKAKQHKKEAKDLKSNLEFVWVVFDRDGHENIPQAFDEARTCKPPVKIAFSVPCFEYYVLLHFERTTKSYTSCQELAKKVKDYLPAYDKNKDFKLFYELYDKREVAAENAKKCLEHFRPDLEDGRQVYELSAYTNVHELTDFLCAL